MGQRGSGSMCSHAWRTQWWAGSSQKALLRRWQELPLKESIDLSIGVFGQSYLTGEPQRLMQGFVNRKR